MNVFDYFFICGLHKSRDPCVIPSKKETERICLSPALLQHFPENVPSNPWDTSVQDTLTQLCHPCSLSVSFEEKPDVGTKFHSFLLTRQDGFRTYGHVLTYYEVLEDEDDSRLWKVISPQVQLPNKPNKIYVEKSICLISCFAYINISKQVLSQIYEVFQSKKDLKPSNFSIENYLYNLLFELPTPSPGNSIALVWNLEKPIIIHQPTMMELPLIDIHLSSFFSLMGGGLNILRLLTSAYLEHQILIISKDCDKLMLVAEAIRTLMFPFQWPHTYAPVLPFNLAHHFLDAPVPYIMGVQMTSDERRFRLISKFDQCFVDIDNNVLECPEDQPNFPNQTVLVQQLNKVFTKLTKQISRNKSIDLREELEIPLEKDEIEESPPMHRRNAKKRQSKIVDTISEEDIQESEISSEVIKNKDENTYDASEELKNLHAVCISPSKKSESLQQMSELKHVKADEGELQQQLFNVEVREVVLGSLVSLFCQYDKFVIQPECNENETVDTWFLTRETQQNFDKASFLSDQPECHLKFLSAFLETQAFASLIDSRIVSQIGGKSKDIYLKLFDGRIKQAKSMPRPERVGGSEISASDEPTTMDSLSRSLSIISAGQSAKLCVNTWIKRSESALKRRFANLNGRYPKLRKLKEDDKIGVIERESTSFPNISYPELLQKGEKQAEINIFQSSTHDPDMNWHHVQETKKNLMRQLSISEFSPEVIAQTNWKFLEKLLKDVKLKTKKLLVRKMGQEAIELGHTETSIMGLEENTLIGSLCDLLERIWCHGLHSSHKKGKSALWSHLLMYEEDARRIQQIPRHKVLETYEGSQLVSLSHHQSMPSILPVPPRLSPQPIRRNNDDSFHDRRFSQPVVSSDNRYIVPISSDIIHNIRRIQQLREVQTGVGKCRAWIRLSLERKQLQMHLKKLLSNRPLLQTMYKRYSLLRCDDEREQFLYHLLSLNAVDFSCFTNSFTKTMIEYHVWIFPKKQLSGISQTSANVYIIVSGELTCTSKIPVPKGCIEFSFQHQNIGVMTTMILGHDNAGLLPKWLVDFVLIRNESTGQAYYLPCGCWLGRGVDDSSTQRLLLAETVPLATDLNQFIHDIANNRPQLRGLTPSPNTNIINDLQDRVGQAVNAIVKHFHSSTLQRVSFAATTRLLCHPTGLITVLSQVFQHGLKSAGIFRKQIFAWDVITAVCQVLSGKSPAVKQESSLYKSTLSNLGEMLKNVSPQRTIREVDSAMSSGRSSPQQTGRHDEGLIRFKPACEEQKSDRLIQLQTLISACYETRGLGKDDMFQVLMCIGLKEHSLSNWINCISSVARDGTQLYEKSAFMCNSNAISFITRILDNLTDYKIQLENIVMRGLETLVNE